MSKPWCIIFVIWMANFAAQTYLVSFEIAVISALACILANQSEIIKNQKK